MEDKDHLKEILSNIDCINEPIDLEGVILKAIHKEETTKVKIARYKAKGIKALIASFILIIVLGILFSLPSYVRSIEDSIIAYTSIILVLIVFFVQLEISETKKFKNLNNS